MKGPYEESHPTMSRNGLGSLADLAKILEEASNPASDRREDRKEVKPKPVVARKAPSGKQKRVLDPKRKAWYERRVKEQAEEAVKTDAEALPVETGKTPANTKAAAVRLGGLLFDTLAAAKDKDKNAKPEQGKQRAEAWKRKPGDPIF
jgi:hypothetical protein